MNVPNFILLYAFRYALGRRTTAPSDINEEIRKNVEYLKNFEIDMMIHEITFEEERNNLGDNCDKQIWIQLREFLTNEIKVRNENNNASNAYFIKQ